MSAPETLRYDYVVVGAGSAGCVLANRLTENPDIRVCLIEAGGEDRNPWLHIPVGYYYTMGTPAADWCFSTEPQAHLSGRSLKYPRGRVLGGTSAINGMVYIRGHAADYDGWLQMGNVGWGWEDVLPYFRKSEDQARGESAAHGVGGPLRVEDLRVSWDALDAVCDAAAETGIARRADFNEGDNEGVGPFQVTQKTGRRMSTARAFLKPARTRRNLTVMTKSQATRIRFEGQRAIGVEYSSPRGDRFVAADAEVILAAGAVGSPHLLMLSGIGDAAALAGVGIASVHHAPDVGAHLQEHPTVRTMYRLRDTVTLNQQMSSLSGRVAIGLNYLLFRRGPMTMAPGVTAAFVKSAPSEIAPDLCLVFYPLTYDTIGDPPHRFPGLSAAAWVMRPESRGTVTLRSADPFEAPAIDPNLLSAPNDLRRAVHGVRTIREIMNASAMAKYRPIEFAPGAEHQAEDAIAEMARQHAAAAFHTSGTCRMGPDDRAVVDARLRVRGVEGLRVADASIMPTVVSGNTNAPAIMIGEKASAMILQDRA